MRILRLFFLLLSSVLTAFMFPSDFLSQQKKFDRVKAALDEKARMIEILLWDNGLETGDLNILIMAYKSEDELEIYVKKKSAIVYKKLISYNVCAKSGQLGPKRRQGDTQVPEGFYHINRFNPTSNFYLSLGIDYPNQSDKKKSNAKYLGGDIFIHGDCVTIGCLPMTDEKIKEIYLYAVYAKNNGQNNIPVYIFPFKMTDPNVAKYIEDYKKNSELIYLWSNLKTGYDEFQKNKMELEVGVDSKGNYSFD